jgi:uncharacterized protein VirK/YbjX
MKTIELKKSTLALYKGLGKTEEEISVSLGITVKEVKEAMLTFGLSKSRKTVSKEYQITLIDDTTVSEVNNIVSVQA